MTVASEGISITFTRLSCQKDLEAIQHFYPQYLLLDEDRNYPSIIEAIEIKAVNGTPLVAYGLSVALDCAGPALAISRDATLLAIGFDHSLFLVRTREAQAVKHHNLDTVFVAMMTSDSLIVIQEELGLSAFSFETGLDLWRQDFGDRVVDIGFTTDFIAVSLESGQRRIINVVDGKRREN